MLSNANIMYIVGCIVICIEAYLFMLPATKCRQYLHHSWRILSCGLGSSRHGICSTGYAAPFVLWWLSCCSSCTLHGSINKAPE